MAAASQLMEEREPLGKAFFGSLAVHGGIVGVVFALSYFHLIDHWGSQHASSGSVGATMVKTIPIPRHEGPINPLANDTKVIAPQEVTPVAKPKPEVKVPEPNAIALPDHVEKPKKPQKPQPKQVANVFKPATYQDCLLYTSDAADE